MKKLHRIKERSSNNKKILVEYSIRGYKRYNKWISFGSEKAKEIDKKRKMYLW